MPRHFVSGWYLFLATCNCSCAIWIDCCLVYCSINTHILAREMAQLGCTAHLGGLVLVVGSREVRQMVLCGSQTSTYL